jgi:uncharacterized protein YndB with AHSA1/START domain
VLTLARIDLDTEGEVPGIDLPQFRAYAGAAEGDSPVSRALAGIPEPSTRSAEPDASRGEDRNMIKHSIEINCPAEDVFAYLDQVDRHNEWQGSLVSTTVETDGPVRVGTRVVERRNVPGGARDFPFEITQHDPPRKLSLRGTTGLIRPVGTYTVDPIGESSSRMNSELDLTGHGIGKLFAPLALRQAARQMPADHERFKELLETSDAQCAPMLNDADQRGARARTRRRSSGQRRLRRASRRILGTRAGRPG